MACTGCAERREKIKAWLTRIVDGSDDKLLIVEYQFDDGGLSEWQVLHRGSKADCMATAASPVGYIGPRANVVAMSLRLADVGASMEISHG